MVTVLKLGGSVVTVKDEPETVDGDSLARAATAVGEFQTTNNGALVIVHGGGSFGHHHADRHDISQTTGTVDAGAIRDVHQAMKRLNGTVVEALGERGVPAIPVHPLSIGARDREGILTLPTVAVASMLREGLVPVLHGDVVAHDGHGATVLSGDELVVSLARTLGADRVGLCSAVPGVLDEDGAVIDRIEAFADVADAFDASAGTDVTGGMAGKVETLLALETPASVFGLDGLGPFLRGEQPGTLLE